MIWQAWAILVLAGVGSAYLAFVPKKAPVVTSLSAIGTLTVASLGARDLTIYSNGQAFSNTEAGIAILCGLGAVVSSVVFLAAMTGVYGDQDDEDSPTGGVEAPAGQNESLLDKVARKLT